MDNKRTPSSYLTSLMKFKYRIALTYCATVLGSVFLFLYPYATGVAIDGALNKEPLALLPLILIWSAHLIVDGFRQVYDTRTFTRVFADAAAEMINVQKHKGKSTSEISARVNMMEELTWFFGSSLPELLISVITPIGGLIILFTLSIPVACSCFLLIVIAILFNLWLYPKFKSRQVQINSLNELSVGCIDSGVQVDEHYRKIGHAFVRISDLNASSWMSVQAMAIAVVAFGIWTSGNAENITPGEVYTTVSYIWRALDGAFAVPNYAQQFARLSDIWRRVTDETSG
jgi:ABC-type multidrug transport system fused ATPase/permease subunit